LSSVREGSREWANQKLRFAIYCLTDITGYGCQLKGRMQDALFTKEALLKHGFVWQAKIVDYWIHRAQQMDKEGYFSKGFGVSKIKSSFTGSSEPDSLEEQERTLSSQKGVP
jgi:hypothetical protein